MYNTKTSNITETQDIQVHHNMTNYSKESIFHYKKDAKTHLKYSINISPIKKNIYSVNPSKLIKHPIPMQISHFKHKINFSFNREKKYKSVSFSKGNWELK